MAKTKINKKDLVFVEEAENAKNYLAYDNVKLYATTDIPLHGPLPGEQGSVIPLSPQKLWEEFDPNGEALDAYLLGEEDGRKDYVFRAEHRPDGDLSVQLSVYAPDYPSKKAVLLIGDRDLAPQQGVIDAVVKTGCYVFVADYNALLPGSGTTFPSSLAYGKHGSEGIHLTKKCTSPKNGCPYLYALIQRRALAFIREEYHLKETILLGVGSGTEIAMTVAGLEPTSVIALACIGGAGYTECVDVPRYPVYRPSYDEETLAYVVSSCGVSYLKNYPHPVFTAIGSNGTKSDVDRLSALKGLIKGPLTVAISPQCADNIDADAFFVCLNWLTYSFWHSDFPAPPVTHVEINRDGTVYANVTAKTVPPIKSATLHYSYGNNNHVTRLWESALCETVGIGQYVAKMTFRKPCGFLFYYTEIEYINGLRVTETPLFADLSDYRVAVAPSKPTAVLFRYGAEGTLCEVGDNAVILSKMITEGTVPMGAKGAVCKEGSMRLFLGDSCHSIEDNKILQVDCYSPEDYFPLELVLSVGTPAVEYRSVKTLQKDVNFTGLKFRLVDFKDSAFRPLPAWRNVNTITIMSKNVLINKLTFI